MNEWVLFTIGIFIGSIAGVIQMALLSSRRYNDMTYEIMELRAQRKLLKEEIVKLSTRRKPNPRKKRRNVKTRS